MFQHRRFFNIHVQDEGPHLGGDGHHSKFVFAADLYCDEAMAREIFAFIAKRFHNNRGFSSHCTFNFSEIEEKQVTLRTFVYSPGIGVEFDKGRAAMDKFLQELPYTFQGEGI